MEKKKLPRGLRNNNPLNIRCSNDKWSGQTGCDDAGFCTFLSKAYGYRAAFRILFTYKRLYKETTVLEIIKRWAPPTENNTKAYIEFVCDVMHTFPTKSFNMGSTDTAEMYDNMSLVYAMALMENGWNTEIDLKDVEVGYRLAFGICEKLN